MDRSLRRELKSTFGSNNYAFDTTTYKQQVALKIKHGNGFLKIYFPKNRIAPSSARIFALWITFHVIVLIEKNAALPKTSEPINDEEESLVKRHLEANIGGG